MREKAASTPQEASQSTWRRGWSAFNKWRRERWRFRLLVLLLIFGWPVYGRLAHRSTIVGLLRIACDAIEQAGWSSTDWYLRRYYKAQEAQNLQTILRLAFDANRDGAVDASETESLKAAAGLDAEQLRVEPSRADLVQLIEAASACGLTPPGYTTDAVLWRIYDAAWAKAERMRERQRAEVDAMIEKAYDWPDYRDPAVWRDGAIAFIAGLQYVLPFGGLLGLALWFLVLLAATMAFRSRRPFAGAVAGTGTALAFTAWVLLAASRSSWGPHAVAPLYLIGTTSLGAAVGLAAGRLGTRLHDRGRCVLTAGLVAGCVLSAWGLASVAYVRWVMWAMGWTADPSSVAVMTRPAWLRALVGASVAMVFGAVLLWMQRMRAKKAGRHDGEGVQTDVPQDR